MTRAVFVDTAHYVAVLVERDSLHADAMAIGEELARVRDLTFITSEGVLMEVLTFVSRLGPHYRARAVQLVEELRSASDIEIVPVSHELFEAAFELYRSRSDKTYSSVDCMSIVICRARAVEEVLTADEDFIQEGFRILLGPRALL